MFDVKAIRDDPEGFDAAMARRGLAPQAQAILDIDRRRRQVVAETQALQEQRNAASKRIGQAKAKGEDADALIAEVAELKSRMQAGEDKVRELDAEIEGALAGLPNLPAADVPDGADETANVEVRRVGEPRESDFAAREHFEIGEALGQMDFEAAARMSGARFVVLTGALAQLERALAAFMLDLQTAEHGYREVRPPYLVRDAAMFGTGQLPKFSDDLFMTLNNASVWEAVAERLASPEAVFDSLDRAFKALERAHKEEAASGRHNMWLIPTAEVPLTNLVRERILDEAELPMRVCAYTPCFRAEAGAAGKDTRGMIRVHQFDKVELVSVTRPEDSEAELERMTACAEEVLKRLDLAYRVVLLSSGDMGFAARKTYDLEVWLPGQKRYREISSCSNCGDFQARRMGARFRPADAKGTRFPHTLNGSGLAVGRALVAVLETYQNADGTVTVPEALRPYMGGRALIGPQ